MQSCEGLVFRREMAIEEDDMRYVIVLHEQYALRCSNCIVDI
jgi:hypothetical protein